MPVFPGARLVPQMSWEDEAVRNQVFTTDAAAGQVVRFYRRWAGAPPRELRLSSRTEYEFRRRLDDGARAIVHVRPVPDALRDGPLDGAVSIVINVRKPTGPQRP